MSSFFCGLIASLTNSCKSEVMKKQHLPGLPSFLSLGNNLSLLQRQIKEHFDATDVLTLTELFEKRVAERTEEVLLQKALIEAEKDHYERLLYTLLPETIAKELIETGGVRPSRYEDVSVLISDIVDFTNISSTIKPARLVEELKDIFEGFDDLVKEFGLEKIKTVGDSYMAASGLPKACADHAIRCVRAAISMLRCIEKHNQTNHLKWNIRIGVHSGPVVAGVIGKSKFTFDLWGDTVNMASRMESNAIPGTVNLSAYTHALVKNKIQCTHRGKVPVKGKGKIDMYYIGVT